MQCNEIRVGERNIIKEIRRMGMREERWFQGSRVARREWEGGKWGLGEYKV